MGRREEYLDGNGDPGADPARPGADDYQSAAAVARGFYAECSSLPASARVALAKYAAGTALHESHYALNERDTEASGKVTGGIFQLTIGGTRVDFFGDAAAQLMPEKDPYLLSDACAIMAAKTVRDMRKLMAAAQLGDDYDSFFARGGAGYLVIAHNQGMGSASNGKGALGTIDAYGLDWSGSNGYAARNANLILKNDDGSIRFNGPATVAYGNDAISGGPHWDDSYVADLESDDGSSDGGDGSGGAAGGGLFASVDAATSTRIRMAVAALVLLLVAYWAATRGPLKGKI